MTVPTTTSSLTVAVTGATGQQGGATARALLDAGVTVRAITRDAGSDAAQALAAAGAEVVTADLTDLASLRTAFARADRVFAMATMTEGGIATEIAQGATIAQAAQETEVGHLLYSSVGGAERHSGIPHFESKRQTEQRLTELGVPSTFLRPVYFMENLLQAATVEDGVVVVRQPFPDGVPLQMVAVSDIGTAAAAILLDPTAAPEALELGGDTLTGSGIAAAFGVFAGLPSRYEALPLSVFDGNEDLQKMFGWFATGGPDGVAYDADFDLSRRLVPQLHSLADWLPTSGWSTGR